MKGETSWSVVTVTLRVLLLPQLGQHGLYVSTQPEKGHHDPSSEPALQFRNIPPIPFPCFSQDPEGLKSTVTCQGSHGQQVAASKLVEAPAAGPLLFHSITW